VIDRCSVANREVYAVPGNVTSRNSFGTNYLIKGAGAKLVQQWQDVAAELPPEIAARLLPPEPANKKADTVGAAQQAALPADLSESERAVMKLLSADEAMHIDALVGASNLSVSVLTGILFGLEMRELIRQLPGKCFVRKL
jgi:DNA processing protein